MANAAKSLPVRTRIAGRQTVASWSARKAKLIIGGDQGDWRSAYADFFYERLRVRYLRPIQLLEETRRWNGEGFAIVALQCSLIEFLGATLQGKKYKHDPDGANTDPDAEYSGSAKMFTWFLTSAPPFNEHFDKKSASAFYSNVRCPLLHEARTSGGWVIRVGGVSEDLIDKNEKIVWRDRFPGAFRKFLSWYEEELATNKDYQSAFLRKLNGLCEE